MKSSELKKLVRDIDYLATMYNKTLIENIVRALHPADLAQILQQLSDQNRERILHLLDNELASEVLAHMNPAVRENILENLSPDQIIEMTSEMESDDLTDLVAQLPEDIAEKVLSKMDIEDSAEIKELLQHEEKTAGSIMAKEYVAVNDYDTVDEAIAEVRSMAEEVDHIYYVFVVDNRGILVGVLSLKSLILSKGSVRIADIMDRDIVSVDTERDQEEVAFIARKYDLVSIPVVTQGGTLVGRITFDDVMDVLDEEAAEDINKMAGIGEEEMSVGASSFKLSRIRLPWLIIGLFGGLLAAVIIGSFEETLESQIVLGFFTPVIMSMGGSIGIQSSTIIVRGFATGEVSFFDAYKYLFKEMKVAMLNGFVCSVLFFVIAWIWQDVQLGILMGSSLFSVMIVASLIGSSVPLALKKFDVDPAIATGPFITISNDIIGLIIYFSLASLILL